MNESLYSTIVVPNIIKPLFQVGYFTSQSGQLLKWKIECDALTDEEWAGAARIAIDYLPDFSYASGVPRGGIQFARALNKYATKGPTLIVDDVFTTGRSIED